MTVSRSIRNLAAALALALAGAGAATAQTSTSLSLDDGRTLAAQAVLSGDFALARDLAEALLEADPRDRTALVVLAAALPRLGQAKLGRQAGVAAYRYSDTDVERYEAARLTALAAANEGRYTLAQLWLRRAALVAPSDAALARTRADYRGIRRLNPWQSALTFSFGPSDNVNGGSESAFNVIDGLPFVGVLSGDAQALSGLAGTVDLRLSYVLGSSPTGRTSLGGRLYVRRVALSDEAREIAPAAENSDFGSTIAEVELTRHWAWGEGLGRAGVAYGQTWFGGIHETDFLRLTLGRQARLTETLAYSLTVRLEQQWDGEDGTRADRIAGLDGGLTWRLEDGGRLSAFLSLAQVASDNVNARSETARAQLSWSPAEPVGPLDLTVSLGAVWADYPDYTVVFEVPGGRQDRQVFGTIEALLPDLGLAGFAPVVSLTASETDSNVSRFDRSELSLSLSLRSTF